jgi:hypothetical protein
MLMALRSLEQEAGQHASSKADVIERAKSIVERDATVVRFRGGDRVA